ncbi:MAG: HsdR family type I site-specific deoxyribonuclease [Desulfobacteraceae bacterium]|nr:MAG: HsdR family type I site-specific deoxyribonuclease [Desulfobacteraceae bacterium]
MSEVGQKERATQDRVVSLFRDHLRYVYLGNRIDHENNRNIDPELLTRWLRRRAVGDGLITRVLRQLDQDAAMGDGIHLYEANRKVYERLRYGVKIKPGAGQQTVTVGLIDWDRPERNDFAIAEEVTVAGENKKRPDIVIYVNGIALAVLELKRSTVSVSEGIRQNLDNQKKAFIRSFFTTMQLVMAGNDTEGLRYGTVETKEKYYLAWKEAGQEEFGSPLDRHLALLCEKRRFLEILHDFIVFDGGEKKVPRHNQYFGIKAAQERVNRREGGIIWHTQGSGKSLTMVWLAKWIREHVTDARVLIITDRTELDEQIEGVFLGVNEQITRIKNARAKDRIYASGGEALVATLRQGQEWLMCALIHKFGGDSDKAAEEFVAELKKAAVGALHIPGELFVFVDECHRTQSGKLHQAMKNLLPNAMFIGFTGTPLLKADKQSSLEIFGSFIHTYKYDEAVRDGMVLDLRYEARDIDQYITSQRRIDHWFETKTRGLTDMAKVQLKQKWGTMQKVLSSQSRLEMIVDDILVDMESRPRLLSRRGNAMLVCGSIYQACKCYELFSKKGLAGKCAIVTSYRPSPADIKGEESGEGMTERLRQYDIYRKMLADFFEEPEDTAMYKTEQFEKMVKERFKKDPGQMRLLIVVDKLLTGFDAPSATYLYIDKSMRDHGLFQAICRVNRLDGADKEYGYIIDYKDLFHKLEGAIEDYTSGALDGYDKEDVQGLLTDRLAKASERLEEMREAVKALCEPVAPPKDTPAYLHYFCAADTTDKDALKDNEPKRVALYAIVASLVRAYADIANEMSEAGYTDPQFQEIKAEVTHYSKVREEVRLASGDYIDLKRYEPAMRHLLDTYIRAEGSEVVSSFEELGLIELIVESDLADGREIPEGIRNNPEAMAETIENNLRKIIIEEQAVNPKYYAEMSELLDALIEERRRKALEYQAYLQKMKELANRIKKPSKSGKYPERMDTAAKRNLFDNLDKNEELVINVDTAIRTTKKDNWRGHRFKELEVRNAVKKAVEPFGYNIDDVFQLVKGQHDY